MTRTSASIAAALLLAAPALLFAASTPPPGKAGPAIVPYLCDGGRAASVVYESGSDYQHARALVTLDGRTLELRSAPTLYGVRYRAETAEEGTAPLAWSLHGEEARLTEAPDADSYAREERELARCIRVRGMAAAQPAHGDDH